MELSITRLFAERMATDFAMVVQLCLGSPDENATQRVKLADTVPEPFHPISVPHNFPAETLESGTGSDADFQDT